MFKQAIVGTRDYETGRDAVALAKELSAGARLALAYVEVVTLKPAPDSGAVWQDDDCRRALGELASLREDFGVDAERLCVEAHSAADGLRALVASEDADLLVIGASRRDEYERLYVGDDVRDLLKNPPCAVAVAPIGYSARTHGLKKIGVGYDGSPASDRAMTVGRELVREVGGGLSAFQAVPPPIRVHDPWNARRELDTEVEAARANVAQLGDVEADAAAGDVAEALARYGASVDLLVIGSHKHGFIDDLMSGSTAQRLAETTPCALLVLASER